MPPSFEFKALWQVSGRAELEAVDALDTLLQAGVLSEQGRSYAFAQPLVRVAVREDLSKARLDLLNRRLAGVFEPTHNSYPHGE